MDGINYAIITGPAEQRLRRIPNNYVDLTVTSPPYDNIREYNGHTFGWDTFKKIARELYRVTKPGGVVVWIVGDQTKNGSESGTSAKQMLYFKERVGFKLHDTMIYERHGPPLTHKRYEQAWEFMYVFVKGTLKTWNPIMVPKTHPDSKPRKKAYARNPNNSHDMGHNRLDTTLRIDYNVWRIPAVWAAKEKYAYEHPAIFPELLAQRHIQTWSNPGDVVLDPFCGCGTTAKMALNMGRKFIGIEISSAYVELTKRRIADNRGNRILSL